MPDTLEQQAPWIVSFPVSVRGEDMLSWGHTAEEVATTVRSTFKERDTLKTERETLVKERDTLKGAPKYGPLATDAKPEDVAEFRKVWGVPDKPEGYTFKLPEGMPADVIDPEEQKAFAALMHKHNLPQSVMQDIMAFEVQNVVNARKFIADEQNKQTLELSKKLFEKYGEQAHAKVDEAIKATLTFGNENLRKRLGDPNHPDPLGNDADVTELLINIGTLISERGITPSGMGAAVATGEPDYRAMYPASFAHGHMK
jgi:hypothetical protein